LDVHYLRHTIIVTIIIIIINERVSHQYHGYCTVGCTAFGCAADCGRPASLRGEDHHAVRRQVRRLFWPLSCQAVGEVPVQAILLSGSVRCLRLDAYALLTQAQVGFILLMCMLAKDAVVGIFMFTCTQAQALVRTHTHTHTRIHTHTHTHVITHRDGAANEVAASVGISPKDVYANVKPAGSCLFWPLTLA